FVRTKFTLTEVLEREKPPAVDPQYLWGSQSLTTCFESVFYPYKGFVGSPHFSAICRLLGYRGLYIVITEVMKVAQSLVSCPPICIYGQKFVRTKFTLTEVLEREKPPAVDPQYLWGSQSLTTCFESVFYPYKGFVGSPHFSAICRLLGYRGLYIVITEVMKVAQSLGSDATFSALYTQLLQIYQYPDLRTNVCQNFRELGNIIICCLQMEKQLSIEDACDLRHAGPFIGQMPKHFFPLLQDAASKARIGTAEQLNLAKENEILTKERLCSGLVLFEHVLHRIRDFLNEEDSGGSTWHGLPNATKDAVGCPVVNDILGLENYSHFHRVWSAIQLVFCTPFGQNEYTVEEMFGEGLNWAGCAIMLLLGQQRRFEILDFGGHLLRLQRADKKDVTTEGVILYLVCLCVSFDLVVTSSFLNSKSLVISLTILTYAVRSQSLTISYQIGVWPA
ncbi:hypothetical protein AHF37_03068, partial [Paragonimus kellicotti]